MIKYIRNNQKKVMAFVGVFLMISFVVTTGTSRPSVGDSAVGTMYDGKTSLGSREYQMYLSHWTYLRQHVGDPALAAVFAGLDRLDERMFVELLGDPMLSQALINLQRARQENILEYFRARQQFPALEVLDDLSSRGRPIVEQIQNNDELFPLLVKEAQSMGAGVNSDVLEAVLARRGLTSEDPTYESMRQSLRSLLMVVNAASRAVSVVKVSRPEVSNLLASRGQKISLDLIEFNAKDYLDKIPAPTEQQLKDHFEKYKKELAGEGATEFGYKYPNRVKYDAIVIKQEDVKKAAGNVELDQVWEYYLRNKNSREFITDKPATTQPDVMPRFPGSSTTRQLSFDEAKAQIIAKLSAQRADELTEKIRDAVRNTMKADYDAYKAATGGATRPANPPVSSLGVPYNSFEYLKKLRDKIQADHKVAITIEQQDAWQTPKSLEESPLGKEGFALRFDLTFPQYVTHALDSFLTEEQRKRAASARPDAKPVAVWEPTPTFSNGKEDMLIARAADASISHIPDSLDEVREKLINDVKMAAAMEKARQQAQATLDAALSGQKWLQTVADEQKRKLASTGLFDPPNPRAGPRPIAGYELKGAALEKFSADAFKLLAQTPRQGSAIRPATTQSTTRPTTAPSPTPFKEHPVGLIELATDGKVIVAEVNQIKPSWTKDRQTMWDTVVANDDRMNNEQLLRREWFNLDRVVSRLNYTPAERRERKPVQTPVPSPFGS